MITSSFGGKTMYQNADFGISDFQTISCGYKFNCKMPPIICLLSCEINDNLRNIITEGIPYLATVCHVVYALSRMCSSFYRTQKNVSDF